MKYSVLLFAVLSGLSSSINGQSTLPLKNLDSFKPQAENWQTVSEVSMSRDITDSPPILEPTKKKKKKSKTESVQAVTFKEGTGILFNAGNQPKNDNLITTWEHGDILLEFDVMLPKGSNSGVFLQGRYEVQLFDSWGVKNPKYSDMGGIYRNWETEPSKILQGIPPMSNASKAPGLWQHMKIDFKAPKFDSLGNKTKNAIFEMIELNGVVIHQNVEVVLPTGAPIENNEVAMGPLMIQGDHGKVAFKNITYTLLEESKVSISDITFFQFNGEFTNLDQINIDKADKSIDVKAIDINMTDVDDNYGVIFQGKVNIPQDDIYSFSVGFSGGYRLTINDQIVSESNSKDWSSLKRGEMALKKGIYSFQLLNFKGAPWHSPKLGLFVETKTTEKKPLHLYDSYPQTVGLNSKIKINPSTEPRLLRAFVNFKNENPRLSHTLGLGHPNGLNYVVNLQTGGVIGIWRGAFVDATPMWHDRGNGSFKPEGALIWTFTDQPLAKLETRNAPFITYDKYQIKQEGYSLDPESGLPIFKYQLGKISVISKIEPDIASKFWTQSLSFKGESLTGLYYKLAEGPTKKMPDGSYAINDQQYYIKILTNQVPFERTINGVNELVLPLNGLNVKYEIVW